MAIYLPTIRSTNPIHNDIFCATGTSPSGDPAHPFAHAIDGDSESTYYYTKNVVSNNASCSQEIRFVAATTFTGLPNDDRPIIFKARLQINASGTAADRSGQIALFMASSLETTNAIQATWSGTNLQTLTTHTLVPENQFRFTGATMNAAGSYIAVRAIIQKPTQAGLNTLELSTFDIWLEDVGPSGRTFATFL